MDLFVIIKYKFKQKLWLLLVVINTCGCGLC